MINITFVTHTDGLYGANRSLLALLSEAERNDVSPSVILPVEGVFSEKLEAHGIPYTVAPLKQWMSRNRWKAPARLGMNVVLLPRLRAKLEAWGTEIIHTNTSVTPIGAMLAGVMGCPHIWHVREFGSLDYGLSYDWGRKVFEWGLNQAQTIISVSKAVEKTVLPNVSTPCMVIYNGVISAKELDLMPETVSEAGRGHTPFTFCLVGWIRPEKGQEEAIRAFAKLIQDDVNARFLIAGTGEQDYERKIRQIVASEGIEDKVSFLGFVEDPYDVYKRSDAVIVASANEAMGRVTAEGMAAMRPVIGRDQAGTVELIDAGENGLLYDGTAVDLARQMKRLATGPPDVATQMGEHGWHKARSYFTIEEYAERVYNAIRVTSTRLTPSIG